MKRTKHDPLVVGQFARYLETYYPLGHVIEELNDGRVVVKWPDGTYSAHKKRGELRPS